MKKVIYIILSITMLTACKKESSNPTDNSTTNSNSTNPVTCIDNPNINFTCIGTPVGKFSDCIKDINGNTYKTVTIGTQTWMAENLKTSKYNDGTSIPNVTDGKQWKELTKGAWCNYNNSDSLGKIYGKLYNWFAVSPTTNGNKNICPSGWHVPNNTEWNSLIEFLGSKNLAGAKIKEIGILKWITPNYESNNISLFSALPSGARDYYNGEFVNIGINGYFWSSDESKSTDAWFLYLENKYNSTYLKSDDQPLGISIRCIKN
jgi:uncharacterized protein (TIGR02145 family)